MDLALLPERMRYMVSYVGKRSMNLLFPVSVTAGSALVLLHAGTALQSGSDPAAAVAVAVAAMVLAALTALGVVEHWLLVLPVRDSLLWQWLVRTTAGVAPAGSPRNELAAQSSG